MLKLSTPCLTASFFFPSIFIDILQILKTAQFFIPSQVLITFSFCGIYVYNFLPFAIGINLTLKTPNNSLFFKGALPVAINIFFFCRLCNFV